MAGQPASGPHSSPSAFQNYRGSGEPHTPQQRLSADPNDRQMNKTTHEEILIIDGTVIFVQKCLFALSAPVGQETGAGVYLFVFFKPIVRRVIPKI